MSSHEINKLMLMVMVMNHKYFLDIKLEAPNNGDLAYVLAVIKVLQKVNPFWGMILYRKVPDRS